MLNYLNGLFTRQRWVWTQSLRGWTVCEHCGKLRVHLSGWDGTHGGWCHVSRYDPEDYWTCAILESNLLKLNNFNNGKPHKSFIRKMNSIAFHPSIFLSDEQRWVVGWCVLVWLFFADKNECLNPSICLNGVCQNFRGGFQCLCNPGFTVTEDMKSCVGQWKRSIQGPFSRNYRKSFRREKPFVKLRPAYSVKLVFSVVVKGIKIKMTAKFRTSRLLRFEDIKRIMSPEMRPKSFGTFEKRVPGLLILFFWK